MFRIPLLVKLAGAATAGLVVAGGAAAAAPATLTLAATRTTAAQGQSGTARLDRTARRAVVRAVVEAEADVLKIAPRQLASDLRHGTSVSDLARDQGISEDQFAARLAAALKPRLDQLVENHVITQRREDRILDRIHHGRVPFWTLHRDRGATPTPAATPSPTSGGTSA